MGQTIAEKFLSTKIGREVYANEIVVCDLDLIMFHDGNRPLPIDVLSDFGEEKVFDSTKVIGVIDHAPSVQSDRVIETHNRMREFADQHGIKQYQAGDGISHQLLPEQGHVLPGDIIIGSDSHTCTYGALNAFSTGVGATDLAAGIFTGKLWFSVPESILIYGKGSLQHGVSAKDIALAIAKEIGADGANYKALEYSGPGFAALDISSRFTISNMAIEVGAKVGIFPYDGVTKRYLQSKKINRAIHPQFPDEDANYVKSLELDFSSLEPQVALPHQVDNVVPISQVTGTEISQAVIGTCTNGRIEDLREAAHILKGHKVHRNVRLLVTPASRQVYLDAIKEGLIEILVNSGAVIGIPGCSGCTGGSGFGIPGDGENMITTANRNFKGRTGNPRANIYLGSPSTVATAAIVGKIQDPRKEMEVKT